MLLHTIRHQLCQEQRVVCKFNCCQVLFIGRFIREYSSFLRKVGRSRCFSIRLRVFRITTIKPATDDSWNDTKQVSRLFREKKGMRARIPYARLAICTVFSCNCCLVLNSFDFVQLTAPAAKQREKRNTRNLVKSSCETTWEIILRNNVNRLYTRLAFRMFSASRNCLASFHESSVAGLMITRTSK